MDQTQLKELAIEELTNKFELLRKWLKARPFLWVSRCPYSQELVLRIIECYKQCVAYGAFQNQDHNKVIANFLKMLTQPPPHHTPPAMPAVFF